MLSGGGKLLQSRCRRHRATSVRSTAGLSNPAMFTVAHNVLAVGCGRVPADTCRWMADVVAYTIRRRIKRDAWNAIDSICGGYNYDATAIRPRYDDSTTSDKNWHVHYPSSRRTISRQSNLSVKSTRKKSRKAFFFVIIMSRLYGELSDNARLTSSG